VVPEFVSVSETVLAAETWTVPKFRLEGLAVREPDAVVPVPEICTVDEVLTQFLLSRYR
jgi:hypothetical protein